MLLLKNTLKYDVFSVCISQIQGLPNEQKKNIRLNKLNFFIFVALLAGDHEKSSKANGPSTILIAQNVNKPRHNNEEEGEKESN